MTRVDSQRIDRWLPWLLAAALALPLWFMADPALWIDEVFSLYHARRAIGDIWGIGWQLETSPPFYYSLLWAWTHLVGSAEMPARLLSWLLAAMAACVVGITGRALGGQRVGALAALMFLGNPLVVQYALEIRPYALLLLEFAVALWALTKLLMLLEGRWTARPAAVAGVAAGLCGACVALIYTHATGPIVVAALSLTVALHAWRVASGRRFWIAWAAANGLVLLAAAPQIIVVLGVLSSNRAGLAFYPSPTDPMWLYIVVRALIVGEYSYGSPTTKPLGLLVLAASIWALRRLRHDRLALSIGLVLPVLGVAMLFVVSLAQPILVPRTTMWIVVPQCLFVALALATLPWRRVALGTVALCWWLLSMQMCAANAKGRLEWRPWQATLSQLGTSLKPGDEVASFDPETLCVLDAYADAPLRQAKRWVMERGSGQRFRSGQRLDLGCNRGARLDGNAVAAQLRPGNSLWLLAWNDLQRDDLEAVLSALPPEVRVTRSIRWKELDVVVRLDLR